MAETPDGPKIAGRIPRTVEGRVGATDGVGQTADPVKILQDYLQGGGSLPANAVYVKLTTPLGVAIIDPFAAAADPTSQGILQTLGIGVEIGFGPAPAAALEEAAAHPLMGNLQTAGLVVGGLALLWMLTGSRR